MDTNKLEETASHFGEAVKHGFLGLVKAAKFLAPIAGSAISVAGDAKAAAELQKAKAVLDSIETNGGTK